jgi:chromatin structure-remodeling complex protein RSC7
MCYPKITQPTHARWEQVPSEQTDVPPLVQRKYLVVDSMFQQPPFAGLGIPGPDGDFIDVGTNGLPDLDDEDVQNMKREELESFVQLKNEEIEWQAQWGGECTDGARSKPKIGFIGVPA